MSGLSGDRAMSLEIRPLLFKPHRMRGLSDTLLTSHYENNYGGALRRLNAIHARLANCDWTAAPVFEINGIKREELIAAGSVVLHEVYFDALGGDGGDPPAGLGLAEALERDFGSLRAWFTAAGAPTQSDAVISAEELRDAMQREPPVLLDVCLTDDLDRRSDMLEGAALQ